MSNPRLATEKWPDELFETSTRPWGVFSAVKPLAHPTLHTFYSILFYPTVMYVWLPR